MRQCPIVDNCDVNELIIQVQSLNNRDHHNNDTNNMVDK